MNARGLLSLFLALSFAFPAHALRCEQIWMTDNERWIDDPKAALREILELKPRRTRTDRKVAKKIRKIDLSRPLSETDVRETVLSLFHAKYGNPRTLRRLVFGGGSRRVFEASVARLLAEEAASRGLQRFFLERGLTREKESWPTFAKRWFRSNAAQVGLSTFSLTSLMGPVPAPMLPDVKLFRIQPRQFDILLGEGRDSENGRRVMNELFPAGERDRRYAIFNRVLNRTTFTLALATMIWVMNGDFDEEAKTNGDRFLEDLARRTAEMEARSDAPADTKDDILYDVMERKLRMALGRALNAEETLLLCTEVPAPGRCRAVLERN